jgi:hypothetical protein
MPKIDQYLNYVESYTKISNTTSLCIPLLLRSMPIYQPPEHLYRSRKAPTIGSCAEILNHTVLQWCFVKNLQTACDRQGHPLDLCE